MSKDKVYLTVIVLLAIALIVGCAPQAQQTSKRLSVSEIVVPKEGLKFISENGKVIAMMFARENGGSMVICNNQEKTVAEMGAEGDGGLLNIYNNQGKKVVEKLTPGDLAEIKSEIKTVKEKVSFLAQKSKTVIEPTPKPTSPYQPPIRYQQEEMKVKCWYCDGTGQEKCASCGGTGNGNICSSCGGSGLDKSSGGRCFFCNGRGFSECPSCFGRGWIKCSACGGKGYY